MIVVGSVMIGVNDDAWNLEMRAAFYQLSSARHSAITNDYGVITALSDAAMMIVGTRFVGQANQQQRGAKQRARR